MNTRFVPIVMLVAFPYYSISPCILYKNDEYDKDSPFYIFKSKNTYHQEKTTIDDIKLLL